jgi:hypothetical protein
MSNYVLASQDCLYLANKHDVTAGKALIDGKWWKDMVCYGQHP